MRVWSSGSGRFHSGRPGKARVALIAVPLLLAGCGSSAARAGDRLMPLRVPARVEVRAASVDGLGTVLVDGTGHALYLFPPDARRHVTCVGACAGTWPPLVVASRTGVHAGPGALGSELGTVRDPNTGARDVTYAGYPLYRYAGDVAPGTANGQALRLNGGPWYVLTPHGDPVLTQPPYTVDGSA